MTPRSPASARMAPAMAASSSLEPAASASPFEAVAWMARATATDYATFAPLVLRHADAGDPVARRIVRDAAEQIDELVRRLAECGASRIALLGGLASSMQPWLAPDVQRRLVPVEGGAVDGAFHLAPPALLKGLSAIH